MNNNERIDKLVIDTLDALRHLMAMPGYKPSSAVIRRATEGNDRIKIREARR